MKLETLEQAQKAFDELTKKHDGEVKAHVATKIELEKLKKSSSDTLIKHKEVQDELKKIKAELTTEKNSHNGTKEELKTAQEIAEDAVNNANKAIEKSDPNVYLTFKGVKYRINFAVNGKSKEEIRDDQALAAKLVTSGSGALTKVNQ